MKRSKPEGQLEWALQSWPVRRYQYQSQQVEQLQDQLALEVPVALVYNGISHAVMMASPLDLEDFALGFSLSEGIIESAAQLYDLEILCHSLPESAFELRLTIASACFESLKQRRRNLTGTSACGICGLESLQSLRYLPAASQNQTKPGFSLAAIQAVAQQIGVLQTLNQASGACHAAASFTPQGEIVFLREDVGRHNALDKLIGAYRGNLSALSQHAVILSSRASYELLHKAATMQIPLLACVSAPTSAAVKLADQQNITLCGFVRQQGLVVYCGELS